MFIILFQSNNTIFSNLNTNPLKIFKLKKNVRYKIFIAACIIDSNFEEL